VPPPVVLTDAQWARVAPLLPPIDRRRGGRPPCDPRPIVAGLLWVARTGAAWRELPAVYGAWISPYRYYRRWTESGLWPRILQALQEGEAEM
jgi:transposase